MNTAGLSVAGEASPGFYLDQPFNSFVTVENLAAFARAGGSARHSNEHNFQQGEGFQATGWRLWE